MKKKLGVGTAYLAISNLVFLAANYGVNIVVARFLGPESYGIFGILMSIYLINRAFFNTGIPRSVSKFLAESENKSAAIIKVSLKLQIILSICFGLCYVIFAPLIASVLKDNSLKYYIIFLGIMVVPLSILSIYSSGYLNGLRLFKEQAIVKIAHPLLRMLLVFLFVLLGFKIWGILFGYFASLIISIIIVHYFLKKRTDIPNTGKIVDIKEIIIFSLPLTISALGLTLIKDINTLFIKFYLIDNALVGFYTAAMSLSNITFLIFLALPATLMPAISRAVAVNNKQLTKKYITQSLRYLFLLIFPITALIAATSKELINLFYSARYAAAAPLLSILILSSLLLSIFHTLTSVISGSGRPRVEMIMALSSLPLLVILNIFLIPSLGLMGAAVSLLIISLALILAALIYVYKKFQVITSPFSFLRILLSSVIIFILASVLGFSGIRLIGLYGLLFLFHFVLLLFMGEFKRDDYQVIKRIMSGAES